MTYNPTGGFYSANLKDVSFEWDITRHYRIAIKLGSLELAIRDVDPDDGPPTASCGSEEFCQFNATGAGSLPVKVFIESGAACIATGGDPDLCATASIDLSQGGSLALQQQFGNEIETVATADVNGGGSGTSTVTMQACVTSTGDLSQIVDIPLFGDCVEITADTLPAGGVASLCTVDDGGLSATQAKRISIHRGKLDFGDDSFEDGWTVVALPDAEANCPGPVNLGLSTLDRLQMLARNAWRSAKTQVVDWLSPSPLLASMCNRGCGGSGNFESSFQAGLPVWENYGPLNPDGNLGTHDVGTVVPGTVQAWDSGELEPEGTAAVPEAVEGARLTVTVTEGTGTVSESATGTFGSQATILSGSDGAATFYLEVGPGINTVEVSGRGVGDPVTGAFAPDHLNASATIVTLGTGVLTFSAIGPVPLEFTQQPEDVFGFDGTPITLSPVTICTVGDLINGIPVTSIVAVKNNGSFVDLTGESYPQYTGGPPDNEDGCITFDTLQINKTGAYRLVVNPDFNDRGKVVGGDAFSEKFNVKP
jgi:hypothetical protein